MSPTKIEWSDETWNPLVGCSRVSAGCDNCYAIGVVHRKMQPAHVGLTIRSHRGRDGRTDWNGKVRALPDRLDQPLRWRRPRRIFVNSLSDLFHGNVDEHYIADVFAVMSLAPQHTFQILTKRPKGMEGTLNSYEWRYKLTLARRALQLRLGIEASEMVWPLPNVALGVSIENDKYAWRANHLRATQAAIRFVSGEPLLGPLPSLKLDRIDWLIVGGESGPGARPMHPDWVRDLRDRSVAAGVAFHFKQWGAYLPIEVRDDPSFSGGRVIDLPGGGRVAVVLSEAGGPFRSGVTRPMEPGEGNGHGVLLDADTFALRGAKSTNGRMLDGRTWDEQPAGVRG